MKLKQTSIVFAIAGTFFLYYLSLFSKPVFVSLSDIPDFEGKKITTSGFVKEYYSTKYGSQMITIMDNNHSVIVYVEETTSVEFGDKIQATGEVQKFKEDWEIVVNDARNLEIVEKWSSIPHPLWEIAQKPDFYTDLNVNVTGFIDSAYDSYFYLVDLETNTTLPVYFHKNVRDQIYTGKKVIVFGQFVFDEEQLRYKLIIKDKEHGIVLSERV